ncbi:MAG: diacylglycerol kinase family protein [Coriobacteriales bacterium]|jgi:diacylglycerol kinase|nr:diacylglycerol kinase family protein [Coriobacteriales bacterium]
MAHAKNGGKPQDKSERNAGRGAACDEGATWEVSPTVSQAMPFEEPQAMPHEMRSRRGLSGLGNAFRYALQGFARTIKTQRSMRIHLCAAALVLIVGIIVRFERIEWALIAICVGLVLASELINTALEAVVDIASPTFHPKAKIAKDAAAAAVFVFAVVSVIVGLLVFATALDRLL